MGYLLGQLLGYIKTTLLYTTLDNYFNYINNSTQDFFDDGKISINVQDKALIIVYLKRLGLFIENTEILQFFSENKLIETQIFYWIIKELYFSTYKMYLKDLNYNILCLKFLKAKQYTATEEGYDIERIISYTIKCLRDEFEKNSRNKKGVEA